MSSAYCQNGRERDVPITTDEQRAVLADAKALAGAGSLIPATMSYRDQLNRFKAQTAKAGIETMCTGCATPMHKRVMRR